MSRSIRRNYRRKGRKICKRTRHKKMSGGVSSRLVSPRQWKNHFGVQPLSGDDAMSYTVQLRAARGYPEKDVKLICPICEHVGFYYRISIVKSYRGSASSKKWRTGAMGVTGTGAGLVGASIAGWQPATAALGATISTLGAGAALPLAAAGSVVGAALLLKSGKFIHSYRCERCTYEFNFGQNDNIYPSEDSTDLSSW